MQPTETPPELLQEPKYVTILIMWVTFIGSVLAITYASYLTQSTIEYPQSTLSEIFSMPLVLIAAAMAVFNLTIAQILPRLMAGPKQQPRTPTKSFQIFILQSVLTESVCIFGFAASFITHQTKVAYVFGAVAILGLITIKPNRGDFKH